MAETIVVTGEGCGKAAGGMGPCYLSIARRQTSAKTAQEHQQARKMNLLAKSGDASTAAYARTLRGWHATSPQEEEGQSSFIGVRATLSEWRIVTLQSSLEQL